jgi:hypothetical protein
VGACAAHFGRLVGAFHVLINRLISGEPMIIGDFPYSGKDLRLKPGTLPVIASPWIAGQSPQ